MINFKLRDEIQNIHLFIDVYLYLFVFTVSFNEVWTKRKSVMDNWNFIVDTE